MINFWFKRYFCSTLRKIPIELIKHLRQETNAPISKCKQALQKNQLNHQQSLNYLIQNGIQGAQKRKKKLTKQGIITAHLSSERTNILLMEINCQTDFVAKNQILLKFTSKLSSLLLQKYAINNTLDNKTIRNNILFQTNEIKSLLIQLNPLEVMKQSKEIQNIQQELQLIISKVQQNICIKRISILHSNCGIFGSYVHRMYCPFIGLQASVVEIQSIPKVAQQQTLSLYEFADNIAAQILGCPPKYLNYSDVPYEIIESQATKIRQNMVQTLSKVPQCHHENIIAGKLNADYYANNVLYSMGYILSNNNQTVAQYCHEIQSKINAQLNVKQSFIWQCQ